MLVPTVLLHNLCKIGCSASKYYGALQLIRHLGQKINAFEMHVHEFIKLLLRGHGDVAAHACVVHQIVGIHAYKLFRRIAFLRASSYLVFKIKYPLMRLISLILFAILPFLLAAQSDQPTKRFYQNHASVSLGGNGLAYSLNYERLFLKAHPLNFSIEVGAAYYPKSTGVSTFWLPFSVNTIFFEGKHHLETGVGASFDSDSWKYSEYNLVDGSDYYATLKIGYRYQQAGSRFVFRASFSSFVETNKFFENRQDIFRSTGSRDKIKLNSDFHPWGGISLGYAF
ncbi:MAG: hypothetical protein IT258_23430 [Saprospiraceae bacterium]|nr:hypothetical protein [Saprospiraceae bacterium]